MKTQEDFESDWIKLFGKEMRESKDFCHKVWSALANVDWYHEDAEESFGFSFRSAGAFIAEIVGEGNYMDWYCGSPYALVDPFIGEEMEKLGYTFKLLE